MLAVNEVFIPLKGSLAPTGACLHIAKVYGILSPSNNALLDSLDELGAEATVLLGFVKSEQHWNWIAQRATYISAVTAHSNLRSKTK